MKFEVEQHSTIDKKFGAGNSHIWMYIGYDDVNHMEVDAAVEQMKQIMEKYWDEKFHEALYMKKVIDNWNENKGGIQEDYESRDEYLRDHGLTVMRQGNIE